MIVSGGGCHQAFQQSNGGGNVSCVEYNTRHKTNILTTYIQRIIGCQTAARASLVDGGRIRYMP